MAERKPLFMAGSAGEGWHEEMASTDTITLGGLTMGGNVNMGGYNITNMADGVNASDAVTMQQLAAMGIGITWKPPVQVLNMISDANQGGAPPVGPITGDAYVVNNWGGGYTNGDIVEWDGSQWNVIVTNVAGKPPNLTNVLVSATSATAPAGAFAGHDKDYAIYDTGTSTWLFTDAAAGDASLVIGVGSIYENQDYIFNGTIWLMFLAIPIIVAGDGLSKVGNTINVNPGDGIKIDTDRVAVNLSATNPGLELIGTTPTKTLQAMVDGAHGIIRAASGLEIEIDDSPDTLDVGAAGLKVVGLPSLFKVNGTAVGATVTAPNLDTLTDGGDASLLHVHAGAGTLKVDLPVAEAIAKADPVYWSSTNDRVGKGRADNDAKSRIVGVTESAQGTPGNTVPVVCHGPILGAFIGGTAGTPYYLQATGGVGTAIPGASKRVILCGYAMNATDFWVHTIDYGKKAA